MFIWGYILVQYKYDDDDDDRVQSALRCMHAILHRKKSNATFK